MLQEPYPHASLLSGVPQQMGHRIPQHQARLLMPALSVPSVSMKIPSLSILKHPLFVQVQALSASSVPRYIHDTDTY